ncbi:MAG: ATP-binding cassette domain-containing protein, partial [Candidatus Promineifilaceae bacterium]
MSQSKLSFQEVSFNYGDGKQALKNVSLEIEPNQLFVLFGPSHSGKTTLLRLANRLSDLLENAQFEGRILFNGTDIYTAGTDVVDLRRKVSMVFATPTPLPGTIYQNMSYGMRMAGIRDSVVINT